MASRASLNKVLLIGNLTRDPELRYTPSGAAVCTIGIATNRVYTASDGTKKEEAEFHRIVAWNKLAELCSQLLTKGRKVYVEGRLQTRSWTTPAGEARQTTEIVIDDMRLLDRRPEELGEIPATASLAEPEVPILPKAETPAASGSTSPQVATQQADDRLSSKKSQKKKAAKKTETGSEPESVKAEPQAQPNVEEESTEDLIKDLPF